MSLRTLVLWAGSLSLVVIGIGAGAIATSGYLKLRLSPAQQRMLVTAAPSPKREECHTRGSDYRKPELACAFFVPHPSWATFGDSHVVELSYALAERLKPRGDGIKQLSFRACQPAFGQTGADDPCIRWTNEAARYVAASKTIKTVVVSYRIDKYLYGEHAEYYPGLPDLVLPSERAKAWASYIRLLRYFRDSGKNVILLLQPPELPRNIQDLIAKHDSPTILGVSRDWWNRRSAYVTAHLGDIPAGVTVIDPTPLLCDASQCFAARGGKSLYFDGHHLSVIGEEMVADEMLRRIDGKK